MKIYNLTVIEKEKIKEMVSNLLRKKREILFSYIHGSFLKNSFKDIDIAVYLEDKKKSLKYELYLEREIENIILCTIDIRIINNSPLSFRYNVIKNGILLFSKNEKIRCDFESLSIVEYHDFEHLIKNYRNEALGMEI